MNWEVETQFSWIETLDSPYGRPIESKAHYHSHLKRPFIVGLGSLGAGLGENGLVELSFEKFLRITRPSARSKWSGALLKE